MKKVMASITKQKLFYIGITSVIGLLIAGSFLHFEVNNLFNVFVACMVVVGGIVLGIVISAVAASDVIHQNEMQNRKNNIHAGTRRLHPQDMGRVTMRYKGGVTKEIEAMMNN